jgi:hypothetical protein
VDEERLVGGNTHEEIVRIGDTVRRPTGSWTPGVHALLRHLASVGYDGAPTLLGFDEQGREILSFVSGTVVWPGHFSLVQTDEALAQVAASIRRYHDAAADFRFDRFAWSDRGADPRGPSEVLCHNDLAPWNLVRSERGQWTFIDWDLAAPGRLAWDLAWALLSFTPLMPHSTLTDSQTRHRLTVFCNAYGTTLPNDLLTVAIERCAYEAELIERRGKDGVEPYARLLAEGHAAIWRSAEAHVAAQHLQWQPALS